MAADTTTSKEFDISRTFDAPRSLVWKAFTEADSLAQWWGPKGFKMGDIKLDLRPGGVFHYCMRSPDGMEMWGKFTYREINPQESMVFVNSFSDAAGGITRNPFIAIWPLEVLNHLSLEEHEGKTTVTLRGGPINASEEEMKAFEQGRESMKQGFQGTWEQLDEYLAATK